MAAWEPAGPGPGPTGLAAAVRARSATGGRSHRWRRTCQAAARERGPGSGPAYDLDPKAGLGVRAQAHRAPDQIQDQRNRSPADPDRASQLQQNGDSRGSFNAQSGGRLELATGLRGSWNAGTTSFRSRSTAWRTALPIPWFGVDESLATAELTDRLRQAIGEAGGVIPFADFMRRALYEPGLGYYERASGIVGRDGDFYTNVSVGPLFGELLAWQFATWLEALPPEAQFVEVGAHDGRLASDILTWFQTHRSQEFDQLRYTIIEPSLVRRGWQQERLTEFAERVEWSASLAPTCGIIFGNELLDAFPVRPVQWHSSTGNWRELGVEWSNGRFVEIPFDRRPDTWAPELPAELQAVFPDGFTTESSPEAEAWWAHAASQLEAGMLLAIDYGLTTEQFLMPQRAQGTRRGYQRHRPVTDLLADPGAIDLTAQVNLTRIQAAGEAAGLRTTGLHHQRVRLTELFQKTLDPQARFGEWTPARRRQFQTLTHPEHLGRGFQWLQQMR